ncbi:MAG: hypothetical protein FWC27_08530 [Firmicutes bacterium]|nr:hypothetical protein [Bacillota bacterium]
MNAKNQSTATITSAPLLHGMPVEDCGLFACFICYEFCISYQRQAMKRPEQLIYLLIAEQFALMCAGIAKMKFNRRKSAVYIKEITAADAQALVLMIELERKERSAYEDIPENPNI